MIELLRKRLLKNSNIVAKLQNASPDSSRKFGFHKEIILTNNQNLYTKIFWEIDKPLRLTKADNIFIAGSQDFIEASALILLSIVTFFLIFLGSFSII